MNNWKLCALGSLHKDKALWTHSSACWARNWRRSNGKRNLLESVGMCLGSKLEEFGQCQTLRSIACSKLNLECVSKLLQVFRSKWVQDNPGVYWGWRWLALLWAQGTAAAANFHVCSKSQLLGKMDADPTIRWFCKVLQLTHQPRITLIDPELGPRWPSPLHSPCNLWRDVERVFCW